MADKILKVGDALHSLHSPDGTKTWYGETWVPEWPEGEAIEIHHLETSVRFQGGTSVDRGIQLLVLSRTWDWAVPMPLTSTADDFVELYRANLLQYLWEQYSTDTGGKERKSLAVYKSDFPIPVVTLAVTLTCRMVTEAPILEAWTRINYRRKKLSSSAWGDLILRSPWLINGADPRGKMGYRDW